MTFVIYLLISTSVVLPYDAWIEQTVPLLPRALAYNAIGHDASNHTIWLLGNDRDHNPSQLTSYNYQHNTFTDYGETFFPMSILGYAQNYAYIDPILYFSQPFTTYVHAFNMHTMAFIENIISPPITIEGHQVCIVNIRDEYIAFLGADNDYSINTIVQIIHLNTNTWLNDVPSMQIGRYYASCTYNNDKMFIITGSTYVDGNLKRQSSIEYLEVSSASMTNMMSVSWTFTADPLPQSISSTRCFTVNDDIIVIGGYTDGNYVNTVYVIDSITTTVSFGGSLAYGVGSASSIFVDNIAYIFGGKSNNGSLQQWQTSTLIGTTSTAANDPTIAITTSTPDSSNTPTEKTELAITLVITEHLATDTINRNEHESVSDTKPDILLYLLISLIAFLLFISVFAVLYIWKNIDCCNYRNAEEKIAIEIAIAESNVESKVQRTVISFENNMDLEIDVIQFLTDLNQTQYIETFMLNGISSMDIVQKLSEDDLKQLIDNVRSQRIISNAIQKLNESVHTTTTRVPPVGEIPIAITVEGGIEGEQLYVMENSEGLGCCYKYTRINDQ